MTKVIVYQYSVMAGSRIFGMHTTNNALKHTIKYKHEGVVSNYPSPHPFSRLFKDNTRDINSFRLVLLY